LPVSSRRRLVFLFVPAVASLLATYWMMRPETGSKFLIVGREFRYTRGATSFPPTGQTATWASVEITFTNPTSRSVWFAQSPSMQLNSVTLREPEFAMVTTHRKTFGEHWRTKTFSFPNNLKPPWGLWFGPIPSLQMVTNQTMPEFVHELRPGEFRKREIGTRAGRTMRVGIVCREKSPGTVAEEWKTYWSADITPPAPPK
jgi:hypothetical protein